MNTIDIPRKPADIRIANQRWPLNVYALHFVSTSLSPVRREHEELLAEYFDSSVKRKFIRNTFQKDLIKTGLIYSDTFFYLRGIHQITLVRLSEAGRELCRSFGWEPCENEWERLLRLHSGDDQPRHTAAVIVFSLAARKRGWKTSVLPETKIPYFLPDLQIEKDGERFYVEVELGSRRPEKWNLYKRIQGHAVICGKTYESTRTLIDECRTAQLKGRATTLDYLVHYRKDLTQPLFPTFWNEEGALHEHHSAVSELSDEQG